MQKYAHLNRDVKNGAIHIPIKKNGSRHIQFPCKKGAYRIPGSAEGAIRAAHPYHVIYRELPPPPPSCCFTVQEKQAIKQSK